jgi:hypothetical protein
MPRLAFTEAPNTSLWWSNMHRRASFNPQTKLGLVTGRTHPTQTSPHTHPIPTLACPCTRTPPPQAMVSSISLPAQTPATKCIGRDGAASRCVSQHRVRFKMGLSVSDQHHVACVLAAHSLPTTPVRAALSLTTTNAGAWRSPGCLLSGAGHVWHHAQLLTQGEAAAARCWVLGAYATGCCCAGGLCCVCVRVCKHDARSGD